MIKTKDNKLGIIFKTNVINNQKNLELCVAHNKITTGSTTGEFITTPFPVNYSCVTLGIPPKNNYKTGLQCANAGNKFTSTRRIKYYNNSTLTTSEQTVLTTPGEYWCHEYATDSPNKIRYKDYYTYKVANSYSLRTDLWFQNSTWGSQDGRGISLPQQYKFFGMVICTELTLSGHYYFGVKGLTAIPTDASYYNSNAAMFGSYGTAASATTANVKKIASWPNDSTPRSLYFVWCSANSTTYKYFSPAYFWYSGSNGQLSTKNIYRCAEFYGCGSINPTAVGG